ncbi:MAG TPA: hypothetical protein VLT36_11345 [Candidatus Dormibacteraeota bacterium]|nr:hypothetical protein [Candidatus Dormibacteraeota bacterium]
MSEPAEELFPQTQPSFSGRPPRPPKITARGLEEPDGPDGIIHIPDSVLVRDLASASNVKPFKVVADLLLLKRFKTPEELIDFETAEIIAQWHGYRAVQTCF